MSAVWLQADGQKVSCRDKIKLLDENAAELRQVMQDAFDDAILMGVDESAMRAYLTDMVAMLKTPKR